MQAEIAHHDRLGLGHVDDAHDLWDTCRLGSVGLPGGRHDLTPGPLAVTTDGQSLDPASIVEAGCVPPDDLVFGTAPCGVRKELQRLSAGKPDFEAGNQARG